MRSFFSTGAGLDGGGNIEGEEFIEVFEWLCVLEELNEAWIGAELLLGESTFLYLMRIKVSGQYSCFKKTGLSKGNVPR